MTEYSTEYIRKHLRHTHPEKSIGILLDRLDAAERRCAELTAELYEVKHEAAYWESEACHGRS